MVLRNGTLFSRDLIDATVIDERDNMRTTFINSNGYKAVSKSQFYKNRLFWISKNCGDSHPWDTCLYSEEFSKKNIHLSRYVLIRK